MMITEWSRMLSVTYEQAAISSCPLIIWNSALVQYF